MTLGRFRGASGRMPLAMGLMLRANASAIDSGISTPINPEPVNIAPDPIEFENWVNQSLSPMDSVYRNTFTNGGTGYIHYDVGAVAGEEYTIEIDQTRGPGTCLIYFAAEPNVTQADQVWSLEGGAETITLVADGPWLTFRASVGATTTTINSLKIYKKVVVPPLDLN